MLHHPECPFGNFPQLQCGMLELSPLFLLGLGIVLYKLTLGAKETLICHDSCMSYDIQQPIV